MLRLKKKETRDLNGKPTEFRIYENSETGNQVATYLLKRKDDHSWWAFEDLFQFPFPRQVAAKKIVDLYGHGLNMDDIKTITTQLKAILKGTGADKYEKAFARVLELESLTETMADPVRQSLGLTTVYILMDDEQPDVFNMRESSLKMAVLAEDPELQAFFLNWWIELMQTSGNLLKGLSQIASIASQFQTEAPLN